MIMRMGLVNLNQGLIVSNLNCITMRGVRNTWIKSIDEPVLVVIGGLYDILREDLVLVRGNI